MILIVTCCFQGKVASQEDKVKRLSWQAVKLMENYADDIDVDMCESFQPLLREWKSVQELAGLPILDDDPALMEKLHRKTSVSIPNVDRTRLDSGEFKQKRAISLGNDISLAGPLDRSRFKSDRSMETLWSSQSTFTINIDPDDMSSGNLNIGSNDVFIDDTPLVIGEQRERQDTISNDENIGNLHGVNTTESMETVKADNEEQTRPDRTEEEVKSLMDDILERIGDTCKQLTLCLYDPEDTEDEVERKLEACKVSPIVTEYKIC